jgi:hypothetical protein
VEGCNCVVGIAVLPMYDCIERAWRQLRRCGNIWNGCIVYELEMLCYIKSLRVRSKLGTAFGTA